MTQTEKDNINKRTENRHLLQRIRAGFAAAKATPYKGLLLALYLVGAMLVWLLRAHLFSLDTYGLFSPVLGAAIDLLIPLYAVGGLLVLLRWNDKYLSPDSFVLVLEESLTGSVTVNLAHVPNILLGGSTGSGKSVLLKLLLMQSLHKGAEVYIADFKGGVDFPKVWHQKCRMCFTEDDLLYTLNQLTAVLEYRKGRLAETGCPDLDAYNEGGPAPAGVCL